MKEEVVKIKWRDSQRYTLQMERIDDFSICEIVTVGWLIEKRKDGYLLSQDLIDDDIRGIIIIPKENIIQISYLYEKRK